MFGENCAHTPGKNPENLVAQHPCHKDSEEVEMDWAHRVVTKISSCRVNTTSRRGIKYIAISFGSIFLLFSTKSSRGPLSW